MSKMNNALTRINSRLYIAEKKKSKLENSSKNYPNETKKKTLKN